MQVAVGTLACCCPGGHEQPIAGRSRPTACVANGSRQPAMRGGCAPMQIIRGEVSEEVLPPLPEYLASADERSTAVKKVQEAASAAGALNRLLSGAGGGGGLPSWLPGSRQ